MHELAAAGCKFAPTSSLLPFFGGSFLNSSASPSTRFMCLSYAMNLRTIKKVLPEVSMHGLNGLT